MNKYETKMANRLNGKNRIHTAVSKWSDNSIFSMWLILLSVVTNLFTAIDYTLRTMFDINLVQWVKGLFKPANNEENKPKRTRTATTNKTSK